MAAPTFRFLIVLPLIQMALAASTSSLCPLLGPVFPPPRKISQNSGFRNTVNTFSNTIHQLLSTGNSTYGPFPINNTAFSLNVFSTFSNAPLYEYYYTTPLLANSSIGTKKVDGDTVFRIASISKLFTVFALLIEQGDANFNDPITKYVPELMDASLKPNDPINAVQWKDVTIGALASQMSGIGRDCEVHDI